jgi:hypothetical protein
MSLLSLMFSLQQNQRTRGWNRFCPAVGWVEEEEGRGEVTQTIYIHVSKYRNKIKGEGGKKKRTRTH